MGYVKHTLNGKQPFVKGHSPEQASHPEGGYTNVDWRAWEIFGQIVLGQWITARRMHDGKPIVLEGIVCYIHPMQRYFQIMTDHGLRESIWFPSHGESFKA